MREDRYLVPTFFAALVVYFGVHVAVRVASTNSLGFDEAAQVFIAWRLQPGYLADPPLYSWLQYAVFEVFGTNVLALSVLKNSLLFLTYTFVFLSARVLLQDTRLAIMAALSLLLIPQYAWESQRDLTHSVLAVTLSAATLYVLLRLFRECATRNFVLLGVVLGLGAISKYNYMIFAGTAISAALLRSESREALLDKRLLLSVGIGLVIAAPYLYWSVTNLTQATANAYKLGVGADTIFLAGLGSLALATVAFVTPLWLAYLILFPHGFLPSHRARAGDWRPFDLSAYFVMLAVFLVVAIVLFDISKIKDRWLQPMLFTVPIYFLGYLRGKPVADRPWRRFLWVVGIVAALIPVGLAVRTVGVRLTGHYTVLSYPFAALAEEMRALGFERGVIVTEDVLMAGNLRHQFLESTVVVPGLNERDLALDTADRDLAVVWNATERDDVPESLAEFADCKLRPGVRCPNIDYRNIPYEYSAGRTAMAAIIVVRGRR